MPISDKTRTTKREVDMKTKMITKRALLLALSAAAGAAFAKAKLLTFSAPIAAILPAVLSPVFGAAALAGTVFGGLIMFSADALPIIAAAGTALISHLKTRGQPRKKAHFTVSALTSASYLMCAVTVSAFSGGTALDLIRLLIYSALLMFLTYTFSEVSAQVRSANSVPHGQILLACGTVICSLCSVDIFGVSLGALAAAYLVMLVSTRFGWRDAAMAASVCAIAAGAYSPLLFPVFALLATPALVCGRFGFAAPTRSASLYLLTITPIAAVFGSDNALLLLPASFSAAIVFILSYGRAAKIAAELIYSDMPKPRAESTAALCCAVGNIAERLHDFGSCAAVFSSSLSDAVYAKVCLSCSKSAECFDENCGHSSLSELDSLPSTELTEICRALPHCTKIAEVRAVSVLTRRRTDYLCERLEANRSSAQLCSRMLTATEKIIADAEKAAFRAASADKFLTAKLEQKLRSSGVKFMSCSAFPLGGAEVRLSASARFNEARLTSLVSEALGDSCVPPEQTLCGDSVILKFMQTPEYIVNAGFCQLSADKDFSGDVAETFSTGAHSYTILSDGMGIGSQARAAALTLVTLLKELICGGFSVEAAAALGSLIFSAALPEESFATLDILRVNVYTGLTEMYKAGGCKSYLLSDDSESMLREGGYPIGILDDCDIKVQRFFVRERAVAVMYTDGAAALTSSDCSKAVKCGFSTPPSELAARVLQAAHTENSPQKDDVSVAVVKIERNVL